MILPAPTDSPGAASGPPGAAPHPGSPPPAQPTPRPLLADLTEEEFEAAQEAVNDDQAFGTPPDAAPPHGFAYYCRSRRDTPDPVHLLLPALQAHRYRQLGDDWRAAVRAFAVWRLQQRRAADSVRVKPTAFDAMASALPARSALSDKVGDIQIIVDLQGLVDPVPGTDNALRDQMPVFQWSQVKELVLNARTQSPDRDTHNRLSSLFFKLKASGCLRRIARFDSLDSLEQLRKDAPNFSDVIHTLRNRWILSEATGHFHIPPILLLGPPGVGKTRFAQRLAGLLDTGFFRFAMDSGSRGAALLGSDAFWGNTQMGAITDLLVHGKTANPVFVLDEIDKACDDRERYSAINALHPILEPETAHSLRDLSARLVVNASRVIWIATANRQAFIPDSILSRFKVFEIGMPEGEQSLQVARSVVADVLKRMGLVDFDPPGDELLRTIDQKPARAVAQAVEDAVCEAIVQGRRHLVPEDFKRPFGTAPQAGSVARSKPEPARNVPVAVALFRAELTAVPSAETDPSDSDEGDGNSKRELH